MSNLETFKLILTIVSGVCWTIVYVEGIRVGFRDKSYAIPFYALALNFAWELLYSVYGFRANGVTVQNVFNAVWFTFDVGIFYTYFKFGRKYFPSISALNPHGAAYHSQNESSIKPPHSKSGFVVWSILALVTALAVEYSFLKEFGVAKGSGYSAFSQNLVMSILFIAMLVRRGSGEGQSLSIAINKWIGTLAPTILYGLLGEGGFPRGSLLILTLGICCSVFDVIYIWLLLYAGRSIAELALGARSLKMGANWLWLIWFTAGRCAPAVGASVAELPLAKRAGKTLLKYSSLNECNWSLSLTESAGMC